MKSEAIATPPFPTSPPQHCMRSNALQQPPCACVPWRGRGGDVGSCIYCGVKVALSAKEAHP